MAIASNQLLILESNSSSPKGTAKLVKKFVSRNRCDEIGKMR